MGLLKDLWLVYVERAKARKAARNLIKQEWSLEFLVLLLSKATKIKKLGCTIVLKNKEGQELILNTEAPEVKEAVQKEQDFDAIAQNITLEQMLDEAWRMGRM